ARSFQFRRRRAQQPADATKRHPPFLYWGLLENHKEGSQCATEQPCAYLGNLPAWIWSATEAARVNYAAFAAGPATDVSPGAADLYKQDQIMALSNEQKKHFKSIGHHLKPVLIVAENGLTEGVLAELERAL